MISKSPLRRAFCFEAASLWLRGTSGAGCFRRGGNDASDGGAAATGGSGKRKRFAGELAFCHIGKDSRFHILTVKAVSVRPYNFGLRIGHSAENLLVLGQNSGISGKKPLEVFQNERIMPASAKKQKVLRGKH